MRLLLDTHALFWALYDDDKLSSAAAEAISDPANRVFATMVSAQEIALKLSVGRWRAALDLLQHFEERIQGAGYGLLAPISADYGNQLRLPDLPGHRDPYDKLIIAQALGRSMTLVSADQYAPEYGAACIHAGGGPQEREARGEPIRPEGPMEAVGQPGAGEIALREQGNQITFSKRIDCLTVAAFDNQVLIQHGWTMALKLEDVTRYIASFGRNSGRDVHEGFFHHNGGSVISHGGAKLTLTPEQGMAVVEFCARRYDLPLAVHLP